MAQFNVPGRLPQISGSLMSYSLTIISSRLREIKEDDITGQKEIKLIRVSLFWEILSRTSKT
jgi:hypothetical protein